MKSVFDIKLVRMICHYIIRVVRIDFWFMNHCVDWEYDAWLYKFLTELNDKNSSLKITVNSYTTQIGKEEFWTENYPYSYGMPQAHPPIEVNPSAITQFKLRSIQKENSSKKFTAPHWTSSLSCKGCKK